MGEGLVYICGEGEGTNPYLHVTPEVQNADLSSVLSWTSSTIMWLTPGKLDSPSKRRRRIPVVQYNNRVSAD